MNWEFIKFRSVFGICGALVVFGLFALLEANTSSAWRALLFPLGAVMIVAGPVLFINHWRRM